MLWIVCQCKVCVRACVCVNDFVAQGNLICIWQVDVLYILNLLLYIYIYFKQLLQQYLRREALDMCKTSLNKAYFEIKADTSTFQAVPNLVPGTIFRVSFDDNMFLFPYFYADASKEVLVKRFED